MNSRYKRWLLAGIFFLLGACLFALITFDRNRDDPQSNELWYPVPFVWSANRLPDTALLTRLYYEGRHDEAIHEARGLLFFSLHQAAPLDFEAIRTSVLHLREMGYHEEGLAVIMELHSRLTSQDIETTVGLQEQIEGLRIFSGLESLITVRSESLQIWNALAFVLSLGTKSGTEEELDRAQHSFRTALQRRAHNPYAYFGLAEIARRKSRYQDAIDYYRKALRQESSLTMVHLPLSKSFLALNQITVARESARRAVNTRVWDTEAREHLTMLETNFPELVNDEKQARQRRILEATAPLMVHLPKGREDLRILRVGLAEGVHEFYIKTSAPYRILSYTDRQVLATGNAQDILRLDWQQGTYSLSILDSFGNYQSIPTVSNIQFRTVLEYEDPRATTLFFNMSFGTGYFFAGQEDRSYRGSIKFRSFVQGMTIINLVNLEEYLYSVVPSEMPASWPMPALEAQAIAARSYTLANLGRFEARGFDLINTVASAFYRGTGGEHPRSLAAVDNTAGTILTINGRPLAAVYSANHGGYSESSESVWGFASSLRPVADPLVETRSQFLSLSDLRDWIFSRPDAFSNRAPYVNPAAYRWSLLVPRREIEERSLATGARRTELGVPGLGELQNIIPLRRGISGRVETVLLIGTAGQLEVRRDAIRTRLGGIRSNLFVLEPLFLPGNTTGLADYFLFHGAGWGHGVGMCQTGTAGKAQAGWTSDAILMHYYPRALLSQ